MHRSFISTLALIVMLLMASTAWASNILAGTWKATSGNTIAIPSQPGNLDLVVTTAGGKTMIWKGHWIAVGTTLSVTKDDGSVFIVSIDQKNHDLAKITGVRGKGKLVYWTRVKK